MDDSLANEAFVFIKPHAAASEKVLSFVRRTLEERGITIRNHGFLTGAEIGRRDIADRHYAAIAQYGAVMEPADLPMGNQGRARFLEAFGFEWDPGRVRNAAQFALETGLTAQAQNDLWEDSRYAKMGPGLYMARLEPPGCEARVVVNGFYPSLREKMTQAGAKVIWYDTRFSPDVLSWRAFRATVIGSTHPGHADPESIRGRLYRFPELYGLRERPTVQENGVHASAGPLEAARERLVWLGLDTGDSSLLQGLRERGIEEPRLMALLQNPLIRDGDRQRPAFDVLEDMDTSEALDVLIRNVDLGVI